LAARLAAYPNVWWSFANEYDFLLDTKPMEQWDRYFIDTWEMTVTPAKRIAAVVPHPTRHGGVVRGGKAEAAFGVALPTKPYLAIRVRALDSARS
jgi:Domain of unknown function (DUF5605)